MVSSLHALRKVVRTDGDAMSDMRQSGVQFGASPQPQQPLSMRQRKEVQAVLLETKKEDGVVKKAMTIREHQRAARAFSLERNPTQDARSAIEGIEECVEALIHSYEYGTLVTRGTSASDLFMALLKYCSNSGIDLQVMADYHHDKKIYPVGF
jgi:hypothetical protein